MSPTVRLLWLVGCLIDHIKETDLLYICPLPTHSARLSSSTCSLGMQIPVQNWAGQTSRFL